MASYVLKGYTTPTGVNSASAVKAVQQQLGVKVDGVWGPITQAAYDKAMSSQSSSTASSSSSSSSSNSSNSKTTVVYTNSTPSGRTTTTFTPTGTTLKDTPNPKYAATSGDFATASNRQSGYIEHASGYTGAGYVDSKGKYYTEYGALLREDGFFYPEGATISQNGMYFDVGNGWQLASTARTASGDYVYSEALGSGIAPGTTIFSVDKRDIGASGGSSYSSSVSNTSTVPNAIETELIQQDPAPPEWQADYVEELEKYRKKLFDGYEEF